MSYDCPYSIADREDQVDDYQEWKDFRVNDKAIVEAKLLRFAQQFNEAVFMFESAAIDETADVTKELSDLATELNRDIMPRLNQFRTNV
jgi:hypothetical protein